jgi:hypothetical protein
MNIEGKEKILPVRDRCYELTLFPLYVLTVQQVLEKFHTKRQRIRRAQRLNAIFCSFLFFVSLCETFPIPVLCQDKKSCLETLKRMNIHLYLLFI